VLLSSNQTIQLVDGQAALILNSGQNVQAQVISGNENGDIITATTTNGPQLATSSILDIAFSSNPDYTILAPGQSVTVNISDGSGNGSTCKLSSLVDESGNPTGYEIANSGSTNGVQTYADVQTLGIGGNLINDTYTNYVNGIAAGQVFMAYNAAGVATNASVAGTGNVVDSYGTPVAVAANSQATINSDDNTITATGPSVALNINGDNDTGNIGNGTVLLAANSDFSSYGQGTNIRAGDGDTVYMAGKNDTANTASNNTIVAANPSDTVNEDCWLADIVANALTINVANGSGGVSILGSGNTVNEVSNASVILHHTSGTSYSPPVKRSPIVLLSSAVS